MDFFLYETSLIWVISLGVKLWLVYFRSLHICTNYHIIANYMIIIDYYMAFFISNTIPTQDGSRVDRACDMKNSIS
jgi:hypothetical protein